MECIEARALKSRFLSQMAMKTNSQMFCDDLWCFTGNNSVASDDFPVEELLNLDFPEKEFQEGCFSQEDDTSLKGSSIHSYSSSSSTFSGADDFDTLSAGELAVPEDDLENLEWLSQFVDDSTSGLSLLCPAGSFVSKTGTLSGNRVEPASRPPQKIRVPSFPVPVPSKTRSKRSRSRGRPWSLASPSLSSTDTSSTSSSSYGSTLSPVVFTNLINCTESFSSVEKPPAKKQKRKPDAETGSVSRRCTHCQVQKTPQWRTGPLGPKTLCNACGVRFKSGRLFAEYRPACSPTFSRELHSNSHRKVLEMRRKKDFPGMAEPVPTEAVQSY